MLRPYEGAPRTLSGRDCALGSLDNIHRGLSSQARRALLSLTFGLIHTLFALEDIYGLQAEEKDGETKLSFSNASVLWAVKAWAEQSAKLKAGEITKEEYDEWRYNYPKYDTDSEYVKLPSDDLNSAMLEAFEDKLKNQ